MSYKNHIVRKQQIALSENNLWQIICSSESRASIYNCYYSILD